MLKKTIIAPSILSADFGKLNEEIASIEPFVEMIHLDLMDYHFVPNLTFGAVVIKGIKTKLKMDCHLMVEDPDKYLEELAKLGVYSVTVHFEACPHLHRVVSRIRELGMKAAVAINPATPVCLLKDIVPFLDMVLVMSVNPGFGGQKFISTAVTKIAELKAMKADLLVQVDGGINAESAKLCRDVGADILVAGSYIFASANRKTAINSLEF